MKTKTRNKFTVILVAIVMFVASVFAIGGMKTKTAKADSGTTYSGNSIDDIAADFMFQALNHFGVSEGCWILLDDQILSANGAWESLLTTIIYFMGLTPASDNDSDRLWAIGEAGVSLIKIADDAIYEITGPGLYALWQEINNGSLAPHVCGIGIWQLNTAAYNEFYSVQNDILNTYSELMPVYTIERDEVIPQAGGLLIWVLNDTNSSGDEFWGSWEGRPEE